MTRNAALVLLSACSDPASPQPEGPHYQYVVSALHLAETNTQAREFGSDLTADGVVDNRLGMVLATLSSIGLGVGETADEALLRGGLVMLADLQTLSFDNTDASGVTMYLGHSPVPSPCIDPDDLTTCGEHLRGTGEFMVQDASASDVGVAPITDGRFRASVGHLSVQIAIADPEEPIELVLRGARIRMSIISPQGAFAAIGGGIRKRDVDNVIVPVAAAQLDRIVTRDCAPTSTNECVCPSGTNAYGIQGLFDKEPADCRVSTDELRENNLVVSLFAPDVTIEGEEMLSFGLAVELASAAFLPP